MYTDKSVGTGGIRAHVWIPYVVYQLSCMTVPMVPAISLKDLIDYSLQLCQAVISAAKNLVISLI